MDLQQEMQRRRRMVDQALETHLAAGDVYPPAIHQAMRYAVFNGGKRLRPILVLEGAVLAGGESMLALPLAAALEMIHSFSLVHDDLPAMDDDDLRRGVPTCHRVFGEAIAILAGDALLVRAFEVLAGMSGERGLSPANVIRVMQEVARATGSSGMIAGQVVDLESEGREIDGSTLSFMHRHKTGALFQASLRGGALLFGAGREVLTALDAFADGFGLAFQITDDILDVEGNEEETGKSMGSDARKEKATFVSIYGLGEARRLAGESVEAAVLALDDFGPEGDFLRNLARSLICRRF